MPHFRGKELARLTGTLPVFAKVPVSAPGDVARFLYRRANSGKELILFRDFLYPLAISAVFVYNRYNKEDILPTGTIFDSAGISIVCHGRFRRPLPYFSATEKAK